MAKSKFEGTIVASNTWTNEEKKTSGVKYFVLIREDFNEKIKLYENAEVVKVSVPETIAAIKDGSKVTFSGELKTFDNKSYMSYSGLKLV